nr:hypothetical protein [uncultured Cohaesibacter sp.]
MQAELLERTFGKERSKAFTGGHATFGMSVFSFLCAATVQCDFAPFLQLIRKSFGNRHFITAMLGSARIERCVKVEVERVKTRRKLWIGHPMTKSSMTEVLLIYSNEIKGWKAENVWTKG